MTARRAGRLSLPFLVQRAGQHTRITARQQKPRPNQRPGIYEKGTAMTETTVNIPLLRKAVEWAEAEAAKGYALSEWHQGNWVIDSKNAFLWPHSANEWGVDLEAKKSPECGTCYCIAGYVTHQLIVGPPPADPEDAGRRALGLTFDQSEELFRASNTIADVRRIAESIAGERL